MKKTALRPTVKEYAEAAQAAPAYSTFSVTESDLQRAIDNPNTLRSFLFNNGLGTLQLLENLVNRDNAGKALVARAASTPEFISTLITNTFVINPAETAIIQKHHKQQDVLKKQFEEKNRLANSPAEFVKAPAPSFKQANAQKILQIIRKLYPQQQEDTINAQHAAFGLVYNGHLRSEVIALVDTFSQSGYDRFYSSAVMGPYIKRPETRTKPALEKS